MRTFLLAKKYATNFAGIDDAKGVNGLESGNIAFFFSPVDKNTNNGNTMNVVTGKESKHMMLILGRPADKGGAVVIPVYNNNFSYTKGSYVAAKTFKAEMTIPTISRIGDYSIIIAKKGTKFNERNKWTAMVHLKEVLGTEAKDVAKLLEAAINRNSNGSGVTAKVESEAAKITITANKPGEDYAILGADELLGVAVEVKESGTPAYGDDAYVADLADKAAATVGYEYTYRDAYVYLYPDYPLNPLRSEDAEDKGYDIFTMRFAEPRMVKTRDEVVNQIVQVALPHDDNDTYGAKTFEKILKAFADGEAVAAD